LHPFKDKTGIKFIFSADWIYNKILERTRISCTKTYNCAENTASVNNFSLVNFSVHLNPSTAILNIDDSNLSMKSVLVYNLLGKKV